MAGVQIDGVNNKIDFDDDLDTSISANTDDTLVIEAGGNTMATITATTFTINDGTTITTADNSDTLTLVSTDADGSVGPNLNLYRNSGSPDDNDVTGVIAFNGRNDNSQDVIYARQLSYIKDASDGEEDGQLTLQTMVAGTIRDRLNITPTEIVLNEDSVNLLDFRVESNGNTHMLFVDGGNNRVGIGTTPDLGVGLHIRTADSGATANAHADELVIENSANSGISILSGTSNIGRINFGDSGDDDIGIIYYNHSDNSLTIRNNATDHMIFNSTGSVTMPLQPAFSVQGQDQFNVGNGDTITFATEIFDQNADFASNTFTAPIAGRYQFNVGVSFVNPDDTANYQRALLVTSNRNYSIGIKTIPETSGGTNNYWSAENSVLVDMDASDTAYVTWSQSAGSNESDVFDSSRFSGFLVC